MGKPWAVILGASSGFGAATARKLAAAGHPIFGVHLDRRATMPAVEALIEELRAHDVPVIFENTNAADDGKRAAAIASLAEHAQDAGVGVLLHSIAFGTLRPYFNPDGPTLGRRHMEMTLDVMAHSLVYWAQDLVTAGLLREGGRIFAMTSSGSVAAWSAYGAVSAAKCALESHIRQLAVELAPRGITANAIMAGVTKTAALDKIPGADEIIRKALERNPSGRLTQPDDVADAIAALCVPQTRWITGNIIQVDGGELISG